MLKKLIYFLAAFSVLALSACQTMHGIGEDVSSAGNKIQQESREHQHYR